LLVTGSYQPTTTHLFLRLLHEKGLLLRVFTQNIDGLEEQAGLPEEMVVPAHGSFKGKGLGKVPSTQWSCRKICTNHTCADRPCLSLVLRQCCNDLIMFLLDA
jgi:NAD-dependent SIR2 family protein deacetylase